MSLPIKKPASQGIQAFYQYRNRLRFYVIETFFRRFGKLSIITLKQIHT